jgi:hypothetical protein
MTRGSRFGSGWNNEPDADVDPGYLDDRRRLAELAQGHEDDWDEDATDDHESGFRPNYTARRTIATAAIAGLIAVAALVAFLILRPAERPPELESRQWNAIVEVDRPTGALRVIDQQGAVVGAFEGQRRASDLIDQGTAVVIVGSDGLDLIDLTTGRRLDIALERQWETVRLTDNDAITLRSSPRTGGTVAIIDGNTGQQIDVGRLADQRNPLLIADSVRSDRFGRSFAVGDGRNFQTIVVSFDADEPVFFPGAPLGISDSLVVTSATIGPSAELGLFDRAGNRQAAITTRRPVGGVIDGERFVFVTEGGQILSIDKGSKRPDELGSIPIPGTDDVTGVDAVANGDRLVARSDRILALVDLKGNIIYQATIPTEVDQPPAAFAWRCLPVITAQEILVVDMADGAVLERTSVEIGAQQIIRSISEDGCGVALDDRIIINRGTTPLGPGVRVVHLAPDASAAVLVEFDGTARLQTLEDGQQRDLGVVGALLGFVDR